jgi:hypothetical protein
VISIHPMYSMAQIILATLIGGPLGGGWLMALNYKRLGEPGKARIAFVLGVLAMAGLIAIGFAAGRDATGPLIVAPVIAVWMLAMHLQADAYKRHVAVEGRRASSWRAAGLGVVSLVIYAAAFAGAIVVHLVATTPDKVMIGKASVFYTDSVPRAEAQRVGDVLVSLNFRTDAKWGVEVTRDGNRPVIAFITTSEDRTNSSVRAVLHRLAMPLSRDVYWGVPVDIWLVDGAFRLREKLSWESQPR